MFRLEFASGAVVIYKCRNNSYIHVVTASESRDGRLSCLECGADITHDECALVLSARHELGNIVIGSITASLITLDLHRLPEEIQMKIRDRTGITNARYIDVIMSSSTREVLQETGGARLPRRVGRVGGAMFDREYLQDIEMSEETGEILNDLSERVSQASARRREDMIRQQVNDQSFINAPGNPSAANNVNTLSIRCPRCHDPFLVAMPEGDFKGLRECPQCDLGIWIDREVKEVEKEPEEPEEDEKETLEGISDSPRSFELKFLSEESIEILNERGFRIKGTVVDATTMEEGADEEHKKQLAKNLARRLIEEKAVTFKKKNNDNASVTYVIETSVFTKEEMFKLLSDIFWQGYDYHEQKKEER